MLRGIVWETWLDSKPCSPATFSHTNLLIISRSTYFFPALFISGIHKVWVGHMTLSFKGPIPAVIFSPFNLSEKNIQNDPQEYSLPNGSGYEYLKLVHFGR